MQNKENVSDSHLMIVKQGSNAIKKWRSNHSDEGFNLSYAVLDGIDLSDLDLSMSRLYGTQLYGVKLVNTQLNSSNDYSYKFLLV